MSNRKQLLLVIAIVGIFLMLWFRPVSAGATYYPNYCAPIIPSPSPTLSPTPSPTPSPTSSPLPSPSISPTPLPSELPSPTPEVTPGPGTSDQWHPDSGPAPVVCADIKETPTILEVKRNNSTSIHAKWSKADSFVEDYKIEYGLASGIPLWNTIVKGTETDLNYLPFNHILWLRVAGTHQGCVGKFSFWIDP